MNSKNSTNWGRGRCGVMSRLRLSKLRIFYILSLVILATLLVFTVFLPMATRGRYSEVQRLGLLKQGDGWVIQFDILNHEGKDARYTIDVLVDGEPSTLTVSVQNEHAFTYIKDIKPFMLTEGKVSITVYKEGEAKPIEDVTYHLY